MTTASSPFFRRLLTISTALAFGGMLGSLGVAGRDANGMRFSFHWSVPLLFLVGAGAAVWFWQLIFRFDSGGDAHLRGRLHITMRDLRSALAYTLVGTRAYTGNMRDHTVSELDLATHRFVRSFPVPAVPEAINVTPDGKEVWVGSNQTGQVSVLDPATGTVTKAAEGLKWPYRMLFTPDGRQVIVPDPPLNEVRFIDRAARREIGKLTLPGAPQGVTITPDGRHVFQSLSADTRVAIVDPSSRTVMGHLTVGPTPDGVAYTTRVVATGGWAQALNAECAFDVVDGDLTVRGLREVWARNAARAGQ